MGLFKILLTLCSYENVVDVKRHEAQFVADALYGCGITLYL